MSAGLTTAGLPAGCKRVFSNQEIIKALNVLSEKLNQQYVADNPVVLCVMQGGLLFSGHLIPKFDFMLEIDYIHLTRYDNKTTGGDLNWKAYPATSLKGRSVLILDDILDEGKTLQAIYNYCIDEGATKVDSAVMLQKIHGRCIEHNGKLTENVALTIEDKYVFGFGMDYNGSYRQLDSIYALKG